MADSAPATRIRVGVLFGGRSGEHDVSLASAASVFASIDRQRFEPVLIGITRGGAWLLADNAERLLEGGPAQGITASAGFLANISEGALLPVSRTGDPKRGGAVDVIFPVLHGPLGEDGTVQGLLRIAGIPFVGSDVLSSALAMDKGYMKDRFAFLGLPQVRYSVVTRGEIQTDAVALAAGLEELMPYPLFVKPCNLGSSVGISKAHNRDGLLRSLVAAAHYDGRVIVEEGVDAREIECGVLGNDMPEISAFGEVLAENEWYDYESKYTEGLAKLNIPAPLTAAQVASGRDLARRAFEGVGASGIARVDLFVRRTDGEVLVNEINTMPGFTSTSMYPKVWEASGVPYVELITRLIELALERYSDDQLPPTL